jgi:hypothetical protein
MELSIYCYCTDCLTCFILVSSSSSLSLLQ